MKLRRLHLLFVMALFLFTMFKFVPLGQRLHSETSSVENGYAEKPCVVVEAPSVLVHCEENPCLGACRTFSSDTCEYAPLCITYTTPPFNAAVSSKKWIFVVLVEPSKDVILGSFQKMIRSINTFYPFAGDVLVLHEGLTSTVQRMIQYSSTRHMRFADISRWFDSSNNTWAFLPKCSGHGIGYRYMCRFMSGPLYWMPELDEYDYIIRMDDDSSLTDRIQMDLVAELEKRNAAYGYALDGSDDANCFRGAHDFLRNWVKSNASIGKPLQKIKPNNLKFSGESLDGFEAWVMNCNFEVVRLDYFRDPHYRSYWISLEASGLFVTTRLGDHQAKTMYLAAYAAETEVVCFSNLPYTHPFMQRCHAGPRSHSVRVE